MPAAGPGHVPSPSSPSLSSPLSSSRPPAAGGSRARRRALVFLVLVLVGVFVSPLWRELRTWGGTFDWGYFFFLAEVDRVTVTEYGQFPLWNPFYCGGSVHLASPQSYFLSPTFLLIALFGTPIGIRLTLTVAILLAVDGTRRFLRLLDIGPVGATVGGLGYAFSGAMVQHLGGGHVGWVGFCVFPYVLACFQRACAGSRRHVLYGGLFLAWIFGHFGGYTYPYSLLGLGAWALFWSCGTRRFLRPLASVAGMTAFSLGLAAVRLLPVLEFMGGHPRIRPDIDVVRPREMLEIYALHRTQRAVAGHPYVWPEYGNFLGMAALILVAAGVWMVARRRRELWPLVAGMAAFIVFQIGNVPGFPWWLLKHLPVFRFMRAPSRFTILVGFFACALVAVAVDRLVGPLWTTTTTAWTGAPGGRRDLPRARKVLALVGLVLTAGFLVDETAFNRQQFFQTIGTPPPRETPAPSFLQVRGDRHRMYAYPRQNRGTLDCFEEAPLDISPRLRANLPADEYLSDPAAGTVERVSWSPNRIELAVDVERPTDVLVNQNHNPGWRVRGGTRVNAGGLLAARVPAGRTRVIFRYLPTSFLIGLTVTLATLAYGAWLWRRWAGNKTAAPR